MTQSYGAYQASEGEHKQQQRIEDSGYIVTDLEAENFNDYLDFDPSTERGREIITQKRSAIRQ